MLVECSRCGAPLDVAKGARSAKCTYCGSTNQVQSLRTLAMQAPAGWRPPSTWTPPEHFPAESVPLQYTQQQASGARKLVFVILGVTLVLGLLPAIIVPLVVMRTTDAVERTVTVQSGAAGAPNVPNVPNMPNLNVGFGGGGVNTSAIECHGAGNVVRANETVQVTGGPALVATGGCTVRLINCSLSGDPALSVDGAEVEMTNGSLTSDGTAVSAKGAARIRLINVDASGAEGVAASGTADVNLLNGSIHSQGKAITAHDTAHVSTRNAGITGEIARDSGATVEVDGEEQPEG